MTLIAGIKCRDGYIVAADTAVTTGTSVFQGRKIDQYLGEGYRIIVACSGDMAHAKMASQKIRDDVARLADKTLANMKDTIVEAIRDVYARHIAAMYWQYHHHPAPEFHLIIGLECENKCTLMATEGTAVFDVDTHEFRGSGHEVAGFLAQRLLVERRSMRVQLLTSEAVHIVQHLYKAAKRSADGVGGNTEIIARLTAADAKRFFSVGFSREDVALADIYLWSIDEHLSHCLWSALRTSGFEKHLRKISDTLAKIREGSKRRDEITSRTMHLLELENGEWQADFMDGQPAVPWSPVSSEPPPSQSPSAVPM